MGTRLNATRTATQRLVTSAACAALAVIAALSPHTPARAHPLGNFSINRYSRLDLDARRLTLTYVVDRAEIPALQARAEIDTDGDGALTPAETTAYLDRQSRALYSGLRLMSNGQPVALSLDDSAIAFPPGQGGLDTQRITLRLSAVMPASNASVRIRYADGNFEDRLGWQEIVVRAGEGVAISGSEVPTQDISNALTRYPDDMLQSPLQVRAVSFDVTLGAAASAPASAPAQSASLSAHRFPFALPGTDGFAELIARRELGTGALLLSLLLAIGWGALHALTPGHGKTIAAAYLIGARATARHALLLGFSTALTHTASVFALGGVTLLASRYVLPERLFPWIETGAGALVIALGVAMLAARVRAWHACAAGESAHVGIDPTAPHDHGDGFTHRHALPADARGWRGLIALGASGGLLPCPSAMVVMLSAISLQRVGFGLALIVAFSIGLAGVLVAIGVALIHGRALIERLSARAGRRPGALPRLVPFASALIVTAAGVWITGRALLSTGVLRL